MAWVRTLLCKLQKKDALDSQAYQLNSHGQWFSPGTLASSTTKTGRHEWYNWNIAESGVKHQNIKSNQLLNC